MVVNPNMVISTIIGLIDLGANIVEKFADTVKLWQTKSNVKKLVQKEKITEAEKLIHQKFFSHQSPELKGKLWDYLHEKGHKFIGKSHQMDNPEVKLKYLIDGYDFLQMAQEYIDYAPKDAGELAVNHINHLIEETKAEIIGHVHANE